MWKSLIPYSKSDLNIDFRSKAWVESGVLKVAYELEGDIEKLLLPKPLLSPGRVIGLWESTCFEMFIKNSEKEEYFEFNVTGEYNWNLFHFANKKSRLKEYSEVSNLGVSAVVKGKKYCLSYWLALDKLPFGFWSEDKMNLGLTAVLEQKDGALSYWALTHSDNKPNFHHLDSFIYQL